MTGYHSMRKPEETLKMSKMDLVVLSNHVDFVLGKLVNEISNFDKKVLINLETDSICKNSKGELINNKSSRK